MLNPSLRRIILPRIFLRGSRRLPPPPGKSETNRLVRAGGIEKVYARKGWFEGSPEESVWNALDTIRLFSVTWRSRGRSVDHFDRVRYSFISLLRAGNFKFDYKLPELRLTSSSPFQHCLCLSPCFLLSLVVVFLPVFPLVPFFILCPLLPVLRRRAPFLARPDEKLSSLDRDGIIGRPALFMVFIFLEIAAGVYPIDTSVLSLCPPLIISLLFFSLPSSFSVFKFRFDNTIVSYHSSSFSFLR